MASEAVSVAEHEPRLALALADRVAHWPRQDEVSLLAQGLAAWASGRAYRHLGRQPEAAVALEAAVLLLDRSGDRSTAARASVSLALERIDAGRFDEAILLLEVATRDLSGVEAARATAQRALALQRAGRVVDAKSDFDRAVKAFAAAGMPVEEAVVRQNRGLVHAYRGDLRAADSDLAAAARTFARFGEHIRSVEVTHNQGFVAARRGDLPRALSLFDQAQSQAAELGVLRPGMLVDRVEVTLQAGLTREGRGLAEAAVDILDRAGLAADVPEACLLAARACEQDGGPAAAGEWARRAVALFGAQGRPRWQLLARYALLRAQAAGEHPPVAVARDLLGTADELRRAGWATQAGEAEVRAVDLFVDAGRLAEATAAMDRLVPGVRRLLPLGRLQVRLSQARLRQATGDSRGAERALIAGLRALLAYQATLGSIELRAAGGGQAADLMALGVAAAARAGRPARALWWMETVRAAQQAGPDGWQAGPEMDEALVSLRDVMALQGRDAMSPRETTVLRKRQSALEEVVRRLSRHAAGLGVPGTMAPGRDAVRARALAEALGERALIEYAPVAQRLVAVTMHGGKCRQVDLAPLSDVRQAVANLRLALQAAVIGAPADNAPEALEEAGRAVQELLLVPLGLPPGAEVVVVAEGPVASTPWALLPDLARANLVLAPSAGAALRRPARSAPPAAVTNVVAVAGPGLCHAEDEAAAVNQAWHGRARLLKGGGASVAAVKKAMTGADVVHIAAHGSFRGDSPLLSTIRLADGPVTGDELARATSAARLVVLSCCDSGMADANGVGFSRLLTGAGALAVVGSVSPVSDARAVPLMSKFHRELVSGDSPAGALALARQLTGGPYASPTSAGFTCFGGGLWAVVAGGRAG